MVIMSHDYTQGQMIGLAIAFMILPTVFYGLRVWAKILVKRLAWDDYLTGAALVSFMKWPFHYPGWILNTTNQTFRRWSALHVAHYS
jgi:hypothetical protein